MKKQFKSGDAYLIICCLIMLVLFISSSQTYEQQSSVPFLENWLPGEPFKASLSSIEFSYANSVVSIKTMGYAKFVEFFIRKGAHFFTFFVLSGSLFLGLKPKLKPVYLVAIISWFSATGYAAMDEFHQMLTGGRTPLFQDVMLDSSGALTACVVLLIWFLVRKK